MRLQTVHVDLIDDDVAEEEAVPKIGRKVVSRVVNDAGNGRGTVVAADHFWGIAEAVVRLAEALVIAAAQESHYRLRVAVRRVQVAQRVEAHPERVDQAMSIVLDMRAVGLHPVRIAGVQLDGLPVGAF